MKRPQKICENCHKPFWQKIFSSNGPAIDNEPDRLNVRTDKDSVITSFTIG